MQCLSIFLRVRDSEQNIVDVYEKSRRLIQTSWRCGH